MSDFEFIIIAFAFIIGLYLFLRYVCGFSKGGAIFTMICGLIGSLWIFGYNDEKKGRD